MSCKLSPFNELGGLQNAEIFFTKIKLEIVFTQLFACWVKNFNSSDILK